MKQLFNLALILLLAACASTTNVPTTSSSNDEGISDKKEVPVVAPIKVAKPKAKPITLGFVGDIMLGGTATPFLIDHGYDYPFIKIQSFMDEADILFGNLEGPLTEAQTVHTPKTYKFKTPAANVAPALKNAGFDVLSLSNNHAMDYGYEGIADTQYALQEFDIGFMGAGANLPEARKAYIAEKNGLTIGYLAYNNTFPKEFWATSKQPGNAYGSASVVKQDVAELSKITDIQVVSFHWGQEGKTDLRFYQTDLSHIAIDAGADIIIGHHPHILQATEYYKQGIIFYSVGNFTFGSYGRSAKTAAIAYVDVDKSGVLSSELKIVNVFNPDVLFQPIPIEGEALEKSAMHLQGLSPTVEIGVKEGKLQINKLTPNASAKTP